MFIKRAAIFYERGGILEGTSYSVISSLALKFGITGRSICGYIDSSDNFIDGFRALAIAKEAKQVPEGFDGPLYPEDIWGTENAID